jgi:hypothetical protein
MTDGMPTKAWIDENGYIASDVPLCGCGDPRCQARLERARELVRQAQEASDAGL